MSKEASNPVIRDRIVQHAEETQEHIENLERAFDIIGCRARAQKCDAALGIDEERKAFHNESPSPGVLEAFNLGANLRVEHYEIAGYRAAIAIAKQTGNEACVQFLQRNLDQEIAMATFLEQSSPNALAELNEKMHE